MVDRIVRKNEAARLLGVSLTSLWRLETFGLIRAVSVLPGLSGFRESELQAFVESRERAEPNRARVEAALASPLHGRAGRGDRTRKDATTRTNPPAAPVTESDSPARIVAPPKSSPDHVKAKEEPAPLCPLCGCDGLTRRGDGSFTCSDPERIGCPGPA